MKIFGTVFNRKSNEVTAGITLGVLWVDSGSGMKWLMEISDIVDEETESIRAEFILSVAGELAFHGLIDEGVSVVSLVGQPVNDARNDHVD